MWRDFDATQAAEIDSTVQTFESSVQTHVAIQANEHTALFLFGLVTSRQRRLELKVLPVPLSTQPGHCQ